MDTIQLSAVKREIVVFLKSMFQRDLFDLEMLSEILCCCMWCIAIVSTAALLAWPGTVSDPFYLGVERVKAQDGVGLMLHLFQLPETFLAKCCVIIFDLRADFAPCKLMYSVGSPTNNFY